MFVLKSSGARELDNIIERLDRHISKNHGMAARECFSEYMASVNTFRLSKRLKKNEWEYYDKALNDYKEKMKSYSLNEQTAYWM